MPDIRTSTRYLAPLSSANPGATPLATFSMKASLGETP